MAFQWPGKTPRKAVDSRSWQFEPARQRVIIAIRYNAFPRSAPRFCNLHGVCIKA